MSVVIDAIYMTQKKEEAIELLRKSEYFVLAVSTGNDFNTVAVADQYRLSLASVLFGNMAAKANHTIVEAARSDYLGQKYDG